jgi:Uma2 family endonuclease
MTPGVIFSVSDAVIPDVIWISHERRSQLTDSSGHLTGAPELIIEVLSNSEKDKKRDRETKLKLYSVQGVSEYWILDREQQLIEVYRRENGVLKKAMTLFKGDRLISPLLPGFSCEVGVLFG